MTRSKSGRRAGKGLSQRQLRVGELIRHELALILSHGELQDPDLDGRIITVSEVRVSSDLQYATAFVSELGGEHMEEVIRGLKRCSKYVRGEIGHRMSLKFTPEFKFVADELFNQAAKMEALLHSDHVAQDLRKSDKSDKGDENEADKSGDEPSNETGEGQE